MSFYLHKQKYGAVLPQDFDLDPVHVEELFLPALERQEPDLSDACLRAARGQLNYLGPDWAEVCF